MVTASADINVPADSPVDGEAGAVDIDKYGHAKGWRGFYTRYGGHIGYVLSALAISTLR